jgi:putative transcriptional regulator
MAKRAKQATHGRGYLDGQFLIAMPGMEDSRFARTVVFICAHSADGAMGITINQPAPDVSFRDLLVQLDIIPDGPEIRLPPPAQRIRVQRGGPVETGRGFVLLAKGDGPENAMLALGYAGWAPGQLETEIQANGWLSCPALPDVIFDPDLEGKYERALGLMGVDPVRLSADAGHA